VTLRVAYAAGLGATTGLALLAVLLGGTLPLYAWCALAVPAVVALRLATGREHGSLLVGTVVAVAGFGGGVAVVVGQGVEASVLGAAVGLVGALAGRMWSRRDLGHDLQALLLSLLLVFAGAGLHTEITYGLVFVAYAVAAAWTLSARQLWVVAEREAGRRGGTPLTTTLDRRDIVTARFVAVTALAAVAVLVSTSILFVVFPRVGLGTLGILSRRRHVLGDGVILSSPPRALGGGDVLARVSGVDFAAFDEGLYLRAATYDQLTAAGFKQAGEASVRSRLPLAPAPRSGTYEVFLQPISERQLPALGAVQDVAILAGGGQGSLVPLSAMVWRTEGTAWASLPITSPIRYRVRGTLATAADADRYLHSDEEQAPAPLEPQLLPYLGIPSDIDPRIPAQAAKVVGDARTPADKASRLRRYLREGFRYSLEQGNSDKPDPLASFLFDDRRGHCEFFATAFATLLRATGVPARVVGGFAFGEWDPSAGVVVFTAGSAHAWTEWYQPGAGWVVDDATPAGAAGAHLLRGFAAVIERLSRAWDENILEYGLERQFAIARRVSDAFGGHGLGRLDLPVGRLLAAVAVVVAVVALVAVGRRRLAQIGAAERLGQALVDTCEHHLGRPVAASETLRSAVNAVVAVGPAEASTLTAALDRYEGARFGAVPLGPDALDGWLRRLRRLRGRSRHRAVVPPGPPRDPRGSVPVPSPRHDLDS
jgi:hypothetical protein